MFGTTGATGRVGRRVASSSDDIIRVPAGPGKVSWVTRDDLADVAVAVLTGSGHDGPTYEVTGPEALTMAETANTLSRVGGKITYQAQTPHEVRATHKVSGFEKLEAERIAMTGSGFTEYDIQAVLPIFSKSQRANYPSSVILCPD